MDNHLRNYKDSFKLKKEFWHTLLVDGIFLGLIFFAITFFGNIIKEKAIILSQGRTAEQLQQMMLNMQPGEAEFFLANLKGFMATFAIGAVVILVGGLFLYSLSRKLVWDYLLKKEFNKKTYWRWNLLNLVLVIPLIIYFFAFGIIRLILSYLFALLGSQAVLDIFYNMFNLIFLFILMIFFFLVYYNFSHSYKAWGSVGSAFRLVKSKRKTLWPLFVLALVTAVVLSLVLIPVGKLFAYQLNVLVGINVVVSLLFLAWMRIYVFKVIKE